MPRPTLPARLLRQRLQALVDALPAATSGDVTSVHRARVASRRLRAVLPVLAEAGRSETLARARRQVRRVTRALGPIRELDVALGHLDEIGPRAGAPVRALASVRRAIEEQRRRRRAAMLDVITPATLARLEAAVHAPAPHRRPGGGHEAEVRAARRRAVRRATELRAALREAGPLYVPERLHAVRVAVKKLRYALEIERDLARSRAQARIGRLKRVQDDLGTIHDYEILLEQVREVQAAEAGSERGTASALEPLVRTLEEACRDGHAAFLRQRAALDDLCRQVAAAARAGRATFLE